MAIFGKIYLSIMGLVLIGSAVIFVYNRIKFYMNSVPATGRIINVAARPSLRSTYFYPEIEYTDETGSVATFVDGIGNSTRYEGMVGRMVKVRYCPGATKSKAKLWTIPVLTLAPITFLFMGGTCLFAVYQMK